MIADLWTIGRMEFVAAARLKWIQLLTAAIALLAAAAAYSAGAAEGVTGADGFSRTTMALLPVMLILVPLAALILGVTGQSADPGSEPFLFGQPLSRATVLIGRLIGEAGALAAAIGSGLGLGAMVVGVAGGTDGLTQFVVFVALSIVLAVIFVSIAAIIAAASPSRATALGAATFAWFVLVLLYDGAALSLAGWMTGLVGGRILFASVFGNPVDIIRVMTLVLAGTPAVLGAAGDAWVRFLGGPVAVGALALTALAAWILVPVTAAVAVIHRRDL